MLEFEQGVIAAERPFDNTLLPDPITYYDIASLIESSKSEVIVAVFNQEIIGSAYIKIEVAKPYEKHTHYGYLGFMYVKSDYRGSGINQKIIDFLIHWAQQKNLTELRLDVYHNNTPALKAYGKAGFEKHMICMRLGI